MENANKLWNIMDKAIKDTVSYAKGSEASFTIKNFPVKYLNSNREDLNFFTRGGGGYENFKAMGLTFNINKRWPNNEINFPSGRTGVEGHLLRSISVVSPSVVEKIIPPVFVPSAVTTVFVASTDNNNNESSASNDNNNLIISSSIISSSSNSISISNGSTDSTTNIINSGNHFTGNNNPLEKTKITCYGRWEEYEMLYSFLTRILHDTNYKPLSVSPTVEVRVNLELERTALHAISCTGYIPDEDKSRRSIADKVHACCSSCFDQIASKDCSIKQRMTELRKLSQLLDTKEGRLSHRGGLDRDHGQFTDRKLESYTDSIKNQLIQGMADDLHDSDVLEILQMSSSNKNMMDIQVDEIGITKSLSLSSSSLLTSSSSRNVIISASVSNSQPNLVKSAPIDTKNFPTLIVSGNKAPKPFIKIEQSKPENSTDSKVVVTSAITPEDILFWSQIAKGNEAAPRTDSASSTSLSVSSSASPSSNRAKVGIGSEEKALRTPDKFFTGKVSKPEKIVRASLLELVDGMKDTAKHIMEVINILQEDDKILANTKWFKTIICTASDLSLKADSIQRGAGLPPRRHHNPPYDQRVIKFFLNLYRKVGPAVYKTLRSFLRSIPSSSTMSCWDIFFNGSTNVTGISYELINQYAISVIALQNEMVQACIPLPGVSPTSLPEPPTAAELLFVWLVHLLFDETYIQKSLHMNFQKRKVDGCVDGNSMGTVYKNSSAFTDKQVLEEITAKTVNCYFFETQWGSIADGALGLAATFGSNNETSAGAIEQILSVLIALSTVGFVVLSNCFDCSGINRSTQKAFCTGTDIDGRPSNKCPDLIYTTGCKSDWEYTWCPCEGHGIKALRNQIAKTSCNILDNDGSPVRINWALLRKYAESFQKDAGRFEANSDVYMKMFTVMDTGVTKMEVRAAEEFFSSTNRSFINDVCNDLQENQSDDESVLNFLQSMQCVIPFLEIFDRGQIFLKGMNLNIHMQDKNRGCMTKRNDGNARLLNFVNCDPERKFVSEILEFMETINAGVEAQNESFIAKITYNNLVSLYKSRIELIDTVTRPGGQAPYAELRLDKVREATAEYVFGWAKSKYVGQKFTKSKLHEALRTIFGKKSVDLRDYISRGLKNDDRFSDHHFLDRGAVEGSNVTEQGSSAADSNTESKKKTLQKGNTGLNEYCRNERNNSINSKKQKIE